MIAGDHVFKEDQTFVEGEGVSYNDTSNQLKAVLEHYVNKSEQLKKLATPAFTEVLDWITILDKNKSYKLWNPQDKTQQTGLFF